MGCQNSFEYLQIFIPWHLIRKTVEFQNLPIRHPLHVYHAEKAGLINCICFELNAFHVYLFLFFFFWPWWREPLEAPRSPYTPRVLTFQYLTAAVVALNQHKYLQFFCESGAACWAVQESDSTKQEFWNSGPGPKSPWLVLPQRGKVISEGLLLLLNSPSWRNVKAPAIFSGELHSSTGVVASTILRNSWRFGARYGQEPKKGALRQLTNQISRVQTFPVSLIPSFFWPYLAKPRRKRVRISCERLNCWQPFNNVVLLSTTLKG